MPRISTSVFATSALLIRAAVAMIVVSVAGAANAQQEPGARAGGTYVPSTHTAGCAGLLCDGNNPERAAGAPPPPPCQGLICGLSPYSMQPPVTAGEAQRAQEERSRIPVAAPADATPSKVRKHRSKAKAAKSKAARDKTAAARTPEPEAKAAQPQ